MLLAGAPGIAAVPSGLARLAGWLARMLVASPGYQVNTPPHPTTQTAKQPSGKKSDK